MAGDINIPPYDLRLCPGPYTMDAVGAVEEDHEIVRTIRHAGHGPDLIFGRQATGSEFKVRCGLFIEVEISAGTHIIRPLHVEQTGKQLAALIQVWRAYLFYIGRVHDKLHFHGCYSAWFACMTQDSINCQILVGDLWIQMSHARLDRSHHLIFECAAAVEGYKFSPERCDMFIGKIFLVVTEIAESMGVSA